MEMSFKRARCFEMTEMTYAHMPVGTLGRHHETQACTQHNICKGLEIWIQIYTTYQSKAIQCYNFCAMTC